MSGEPARILILGGGFGGLYAALRLEKLLPPDRYRLTVVNRENFTLFTPMLHEVAASDLDITHIVNPIRKLLRRASLFVGEVERIDLDGRRVLVSHAGGEHRHELAYDHLLIALGSVTNWYGIPGLEGRALPMKSLGDAVALRNRLIEILDEADFECSAARRPSLLTFLVAGGGFAGVETVAAVNDFLREAVRFYPHLEEEMLRLVLVEGGPTLLPELAPGLGAYAARKLAERGVEVRLRTLVKRLGPEGIELGDGSVVPAGTVVWAAGTSPSPLVTELPCERERGRLRVDEMLRVPGWSGVWALGDCAAVPNGRGGFHPSTAQHALRQGRVAAGNIAAALQGRPLRPFTYRTLGQLAAIGRRTGVASLLGRNFSGFPAWWMWRTVYLAKLPRLERKLRVALDWTLDLVFSKDLVQLKPPERPAYPPIVSSARASPKLARSGSEATTSIS